MLKNSKELAYDVQFKTGFRVYLCLMKFKLASVKDIQKAMEFPTPAQAKYHLKKLVELGLAEEDGSTNFAVVERRFGILRFFFKFRKAILPMSLFYSLFFAALTMFLFARSPSIELALLGGLITAKELVDTYCLLSTL